MTYDSTTGFLSARVERGYTANGVLVYEGVDQLNPQVRNQLVSKRETKHILNANDVVVNSLTVLQERQDENHYTETRINPLTDYNVVYHYERYEHFGRSRLRKTKVEVFDKDLITDESTDLLYNLDGMEGHINVNSLEDIDKFHQANLEFAPLKDNVLLIMDYLDKIDELGLADITGNGTVNFADLIVFNRYLVEGKSIEESVETIGNGMVRTHEEAESLMNLIQNRGLFDVNGDGNTDYENDLMLLYRHFAFNITNPMHIVGSTVDKELVAQNTPDIEKLNQIANEASGGARTDVGALLRIASNEEKVIKEAVDHLQSWDWNLVQKSRVGARFYDRRTEMPKSYALEPYVGDKVQSYEVVGTEKISNNFYKVMVNASIVQGSGQAYLSDMTYFIQLDSEGQSSIHRMFYVPSTSDGVEYKLEFTDDNRVHATAQHMATSMFARVTTTYEGWINLGDNNQVEREDILINTKTEDLDRDGKILATNVLDQNYVTTFGDNNQPTHFMQSNKAVRNLILISEATDTALYDENGNIIEIHREYKAPREGSIQKMSSNHTTQTEVYDANTQYLTEFNKIENLAQFAQNASHPSKELIKVQSEAFDSKNGDVVEAKYEVTTYDLDHNGNRYRETIETTVHDGLNEVYNKDVNFLAAPVTDDPNHVRASREAGESLPGAYDEGFVGPRPADYYTSGLGENESDSYLQTVNQILVSEGQMGEVSQNFLPKLAKEEEIQPVIIE